MPLPISRALYGGLEAAVIASGFWEDENTDLEVRGSRAYGGQFFQTELAKTLQITLQKYFQLQKMAVTVFVMTIPADDITDMSKAYVTNAKPNKFIVAAQADITNTKEKNDGMMLLITCLESAPNFDPNFVDPTELAKNTSFVIRHELVHDRQLTKIADSLGVSRPAAKEKMIEWGLIPSSSAPRFEYLSSHIELDAFGHEFAENLAHKFGVEKSLDLLTNDLGELRRLAQEANVGHNWDEFFEEYHDSEFTKILVRKIKKYLLLFGKHSVYEQKKQIKKIVSEILKNDIQTHSKFTGSRKV